MSGPVLEIFWVSGTPTLGACCSRWKSKDGLHLTPPAASNGEAKTEPYLSL
jgi:hypothetical protein